MKFIKSVIKAMFSKPKEGIFLGNLKFRDVAYTYRMPAGFPGDVNRTHPANIVPAQILAANPPTAYGQLVLRDASGNGVRPLGVGDTAPNPLLLAVTVRPFPVQAQTATNYGAQGIGAATPPSNGEIDVLQSGFIMVKLNSASAAVVNGGAVYVWVAATSGGHTQGGFEGAASAGNTILLSDAFYNGPADTGGVTELAFNN